MPAGFISKPSFGAISRTFASFPASFRALFISPTIAAGVPAGAVFDTLEIQNDPSLAARGIMQTVEHPTTGKVKMPAWPVRFDGAPPKVRPSPALGQNVDDVLGSWLGLDA